MKKNFLESQLQEQSSNSEMGVGFEIMKDVIRTHRQLSSDGARHYFSACEELKNLHDELGFYLPLYEESGGLSGLVKLYEEDSGKFREMAEFAAEDLLKFENDLPDWAKEVLERYLQLKTNP